MPPPRPPSDHDAPSAPAADRTPAALAAEQNRAESAERMRASRARVMLDRALSASAGVVAATALAVSLYQAWLTRQQQRASVWPRVDLPSSVGGPVYARKVRNVGLGPALVRSVVVTVDGRPVRTWEEVVRALVGDSALRAFQRDTALRIEQNTVGRGSVLLPGATVDHVRLEGGEAPRTLARASRGRLKTSVCYCSLYDDCWTVSSRELDPAPAGACPAVADTTREFSP